MGRRIISVIVCVILIIGGLSGELVLRGTNSSMALIAVAAIFLIYEVWKIIGLRKDKKLADQYINYEDERQKRFQTFLQQSLSQTITPCETVIKNASGKLLFINNIPVEDLYNTSRSFTTDRQYNLLQSGDAGAEYDFLFEAISAGQIVINKLPENRGGPYFEIEHM